MAPILSHAVNPMTDCACNQATPPQLTPYVDGPLLARCLAVVLIGSLAIICPACVCGRT
jgi:hypothetical protein